MELAPQVAILASIFSLLRTDLVAPKILKQGIMPVEIPVDQSSCMVGDLLGG